LVRGFGLMEKLFGVRAMAEQRDGSHQHGKHRHRHGYGSKARLVRAFLGLFVQFLKFFGHAILDWEMMALVRGKE